MVAGAATLLAPSGTPNAQAVPSEQSHNASRISVPASSQISALQFPDQAVDLLLTGSRPPGPAAATAAAVSKPSASDSGPAHGLQHAAVDMRIGDANAVISIGDLDVVDPQSADLPGPSARDLGHADTEEEASFAYLQFITQLSCASRPCNPLSKFHCHLTRMMFGPHLTMQPWLLGGHEKKIAYARA